MRPIQTTMIGLALVTGGCASDGNQHATFGAVVGGIVAGGGCALLGGSAGGCLAAGVAGAAVGGLIGSRIDKRDRARRDAALHAALNDDSRWLQPGAAGEVAWFNPETQNSGSITPQRTIVVNQQQCRVTRERYVHNGEPIIEMQTHCPKNGQYT